MCIRDWARDAVARGARSVFLNLRGESLLDLAEVLRAARREVDARAATSEALGLFEAKGCAVLAARARALLDPALEATIRS
jgi:hypothetical protein